MGDLSPSVSKWHRSSFFLRKQHFFKPTKICHLCDTLSHQTAQPYVDDPNTACPDTGKPDMDNPCLENRPQLNKDKRNTDSSSTKGSNPILSVPRRRQLNRTIESASAIGIHFENEYIADRM